MLAIVVDRKRAGVIFMAGLSQKSLDTVIVKNLKAGIGPL